MKAREWPLIFLLIAVAAAISQKLQLQTNSAEVPNLILYAFLTISLASATRAFGRPRNP